MSRVLEFVTEQYKYTSLKELNTVLRLYNLEAYRGKENSQLYRHRGLLYRILDENGKYIGVPLKASFFDYKPTLNKLEKKFIKHQSQKQPFLERIRTEMKWQLMSLPETLEKLNHTLAQERIYMILEKDRQGIVREISYIDFRNQCIFSDAELGEQCNLAAIQKIIDQQDLRQTLPLRHQQRQVHRLSI
jgi:hypothetical protein